MKLNASLLSPLAAVALLALGGCVTTAEIAEEPMQSPTQPDTASQEKFEQDRQSILAMAGNYRVTFDFIESVSFVDGYELKDRKLSGGDEMVFVVEDSGDYISLQHILVVGGDDKFPVKHWRQDWYYEPESVLVYVGANAWEKRPVSAAETKGKWSQVVYQVDDAPRYGALGAWTHDNGVSQWTPPREWRPLPRRDATTRDDYHVVNAVNRHAITPHGWVHEQDNSKLILTGEPQTLVREIAINTYKNFDDFELNVGSDYWEATEDFWAGVRAEWTKIETENTSFGLTVQGEPEEVYMQILGFAGFIVAGEMTTQEALSEARAVITEYLTTDIGALTDRLPAKEIAQNDQ